MRTIAILLAAMMAVSCTRYETAYTVEVVSPADGPGTRVEYTTPNGAACDTIWGEWRYTADAFTGDNIQLQAAHTDTVPSLLIARIYQRQREVVSMNNVADTNKVLIEFLLEE